MNSPLKNFHRLLVHQFFLINQHFNRALERVVATLQTHSEILRQPLYYLQVSHVLTHIVQQIIPLLITLLRVVVLLQNQVLNPFGLFEKHGDVEQEVVQVIVLDEVFALVKLQDPLGEPRILI